MSLFSAGFDRLQLKVPESRSSSSVRIKGGRGKEPSLWRQRALDSLASTGGRRVRTQLLMEARVPSRSLSGSQGSKPSSPRLCPLLLIPALPSISHPHLLAMTIFPGLPQSLNKALGCGDARSLSLTAQIAGTHQGRMGRLRSFAASGPGSSTSPVHPLGTVQQVRQE